MYHARYRTTRKRDTRSNFRVSQVSPAPARHQPPTMVVIWPDNNFMSVWKGDFFRHCLAEKRRKNQESPRSWKLNWLVTLAAAARRLDPEAAGSWNVLGSGLTRSLCKVKSEAKSDLKCLKNRLLASPAIRYTAVGPLSTHTHTHTHTHSHKHTHIPATCRITKHRVEWAQRGKMFKFQIYDIVGDFFRLRKLHISSTRSMVQAIDERFFKSIHLFSFHFHSFLFRK